ncbi:uncharacterized protein Z518_03893 [Rhinocladiella mackenziei CBS 650.93]|uniref:Rhinocladiella mackenziei CBS 650.93 unplaced genomic scaffold supercont1.3, whole genome shotgun sequence n=1 Tax=Rhinocladiella mackenziei CBS 650.93 TaxID=1442369 RepID=A0A0D2IJN3_9EURO|nr:uncharacterized protein Z518_03893 [Rhinocladiella mackenziei CBS 650.93]KIX05919.1 hypothetical protein Z518_03893 [Rhinocladiella mackenziei CBS 650.93]
MSKLSVQALLSAIRSLHKSTEYSDLAIFCGDDKFTVHKAIICPRSRYFATSCKWGKSVDDSKRELTLDDDDPRLVKLMIDYFYQLDYDDAPPTVQKAGDEERMINGRREPESPVAKTIEFFESLTPADAIADPEPPADSYVYPTPEITVGTENIDEPMTAVEDEGVDLETTELSTNARMYALADKYEIDDLRELAREKFANAAARDWKSKAFAYAAGLVCKTTPSKGDVGLRKVVIDTIDAHQELLNYEEFQELLDSGNGLAWELLKLICRQ